MFFYGKIELAIQKCLVARKIAILVLFPLPQFILLIFHRDMFFISRIWRRALEQYFSKVYLIKLTTDEPICSRPADELKNYFSSRVFGAVKRDLGFMKWQSQERLHVKTGLNELCSIITLQSTHFVQ